MDQDTQSQEPRKSLPAVYANNTAVEASVWDLKVVFGQWYQSGGVDWHTMVTMPWAQAKLLAFYLRVNLAMYEAQHGKVIVPQAMWPQPLPGDLADPATAVALAREMHEEFIRDLK